MTITFLANEGVMLSSGDKQVLVDALFQKYETGYALPADSTRAQLEGARLPFDSVELVLVTHGGRRHRGVEHLGYVVELGGRRVLHVGDTDVSEAAFAPFRLDTARIDVALLPQWMVLSSDGRRVIEKWIRTKHVVAFHVGDDDVERAPRAVSAAMPRATTFTRSLETRTW